MPDKEDAARMIIGPESKRTDLLDATDDVIRELVRLRREREHLILAGDALRAENERLKLTVNIAREMRACQKRYFKDRSPSMLTQSKQLERELDRRLAGQPEPRLLDI